MIRRVPRALRSTTAPRGRHGGASRRVSGRCASRSDSRTPFRITLPSALAITCSVAPACVWVQACVLDRSIARLSSASFDVRATRPSPHVVVRPAAGESALCGTCGIWAAIGWAEVGPDGPRQWTDAGPRLRFLAEARLGIRSISLICAERRASNGGSLSSGVGGNCVGSGAGFGSGVWGGSDVGPAIGAVASGRRIVDDQRRGGDI